MSIKLTRSFHIYAQFTNLIFKSLSTTNEVSTQSTIINDHENETMTLFVNDYSKTKKNFDSLFEFLHRRYFSRMTFEFLYLNSKKTITFTKKLNMIKFIEKSKELWFSIKHKIKILKWLILINKTKLNEFLWLISFLRQFISKWVKHVLIIKKAYMIQMST
jgi:hypothetical protein